MNPGKILANAALVRIFTCEGTNSVPVGHMVMAFSNNGTCPLLRWKCYMFRGLYTGNMQGTAFPVLSMSILSYSPSKITQLTPILQPNSSIREQLMGKTFFVAIGRVSCITFEPAPGDKDGAGISFQLKHKGTGDIPGVGLWLWSSDRMRC